MPRDVKIGIDYFSHDTDMFHDPKIRILKAKYGLIGYAIYIRLLEEIYHNNGYYIELDEDYMLLFADENNITINELKNIIDVCINKELFDINKYNDYNILTSKRIQKNYLDATVRRKNCEVSSDYDLINVDINAINVDKNTTKKSKVNKSKVYNINTSVEKEIEKTEKTTTFLENTEKTKEKNTTEKTSIPYKEIIEYLNLKTQQRFRHSTKETQRLIQARWNEGFTKDDFFKVIDNAYSFRMQNGGDLTFIRPVTLFNGGFESRLNGSSYGWTPKKETKQEQYDFSNTNAPNEYNDKELPVYEEIELPIPKEWRNK